MREDWITSPVLSSEWRKARLRRGEVSNAGTADISSQAGKKPTNSAKGAKSNSLTLMLQLFFIMRNCFTSIVGVHLSSRGKRCASADPKSGKQPV
jgi:hypothetical protein